MPRSEPQPGILPEPRPHARFVVLRAHDPLASARGAGRIPVLTAKLAALDRGARLTCSVALGPELWDRVSPGRRPRKLRQFRALDSGSLRAPSTGGDLLLHILSRRVDLNFELAARARGELGAAVSVMDDVTGFRYLDSRDLTGFIDGTENPKGRERAPVALIGAEDPDFAGGSYVFTQRYVHDLGKWAGISVKEQEGAIGRRKRDSKELSDRTKPPTAHISRVVIEENGEELEILRHSFPYGNLNEAGLFFIAYTRDLDIPERMLRRMYGLAGDGLHDHLMDFTRAVSGANFFAPSLQQLKALASG
jgi:putative iron-dependent peroxidase